MMRHFLAPNPVTVEGVGGSDGEQRRKTEAKPEARGLREVGENKKQTYGNKTHLIVISSSTVRGEKNPLVLPQWNDHNGRSFSHIWVLTSRRGVR